MKLLDKLWPWCRIKELERQRDYLMRCHDRACERLSVLQEKHDQITKEHAASRDGIRKMAEIFTRRGLDKVILSLVVLSFTVGAFGQAIQRQIFTTNGPPSLVTPNGPMVSTNGNAPDVTYNGTALAVADTNTISLSLSWGGPSNTVPVDQGIHFYTTTTGFSFTNMIAVSGSNLWSTIVVSNQTANSVTGFCTIPGIRIYGVPAVGTASNAVIVPAGKTCIASFLSISTLLTNAAIAAQSN